jgi:hypothetical protein
MRSTKGIGERDNGVKGCLHRLRDTFGFGDWSHPNPAHGVLVVQIYLDLSTTEELTTVIHQIEVPTNNSFVPLLYNGSDKIRQR